MSSAVQTRDDHSMTTLGFWIYLMTDCLLFATLFATYAVLHHRTAGGAASYELFDLGFVFIETMVLLTSSLASGFALLAVRAAKRRLAARWLSLTLLLGLVFLGMELVEFGAMVSEGHGWGASAFLSAFFTLVGTHGLHILVGLIWGGVLLWVILARFQTTPHLLKKMTLFVLFWHFLDIIWVCIFTFVYLLGSINP